MKRPKPIKQLIMDLTGENQPLIESLHHGLAECSLISIYPVLDLYEAVAFSASAWKSRQKNSFDEIVLRDGSIYDIFNEANKVGCPWVNKYKSISPALMSKYENMNPFKSVDLRGRLEDVDDDITEKLRAKLKNSVKIWLFECQYQGEKRLRGGDNYGLEIMTFQNVYPKKGKIVPAYAGEIVGILKEYPTDIMM